LWFAVIFALEAHPLPIKNVDIRRMCLDPLIGLAAASLIVCCAKESTAEKMGQCKISPILHVLRSGAVVQLGVFSYSIYLLHFPLLHVAFNVGRHFRLAPPAMFEFMLAIGVPAILAVSYLFHLAFERPFMSGIAARKRQPVREELRPAYA